MASSIAASEKRRLPWYRRLFGGQNASAVSAGPAAGPGAQARAMFVCTDCGFESKLRGVVYDHVKSFHKDVLDRHGHIDEVQLSR